MFKGFRAASKGKNKGETSEPSKLHPVLTYEKALLAAHRKDFINKINEIMDFDVNDKSTLVNPLYHCTAQYMQLLPETKNSYFAQLGGFLDHALERTAIAVRITRELFVTESPEDSLSAQQSLWMYAMFSASMLFGIGKLATDFCVDLHDINEKYLKSWSALEGDMLAQDAHCYDYRFEPVVAKEFQNRMTLLMARQIMPEAGFKWLASDNEVFAVWLALLDEDAAGAGTLGPILIRADAMAINRDLQHKEFKEGQNARDGVKFSQVAPSFSTPLGRQAGDLSSESIAGGPEFMRWLSIMLNRGRFMVNQSPLFMVPGGLLMCPDIFKYFIREHPEFKNWQSVQQAVINMQVHAQGADTKAVQRFTQLSTQQQFSGIVLAKVDMVMTGSVKVKSVSGGQIKSMTAAEIARQPQLKQGMANSVGAGVNKTQYLSTKGDWVEHNATNQSKQNPSRQK